MERKEAEGFLEAHPVRNPDGSINVEAELAAIKREKKRLGLIK